jgi:flagellar basal-body rod modification protein FlgD
MSPSITGSTTTTSPTATTAATQSPLDPLANEQTFLKLLVSQLQNQDPLNPTDSNQFVSQLTAYSQLEQLIGIRQNTAPAASASTTPATPNTTTTN